MTWTSKFRYLSNSKYLQKAPILNLEHAVYHQLTSMEVETVCPRSLYQAQVDKHVSHSDKQQVCSLVLDRKNRPLIDMKVYLYQKLRSRPIAYRNYSPCTQSVHERVKTRERK